MQEVADAGEVPVLKEWKRKKWIEVVERPMGEVYVWSEMDAGNWRADRGKGKFDIETGWAQIISCWEMRGEA